MKECEHLNLSNYGFNYCVCDDCGFKISVADIKDFEIKIRTESTVI